VRRDADGFFTIVGRAKDMIISGGENVYAAEVEAVLHDHPAVAEAALVGVPDERWGEVGVAFVVARAAAGPASGAGSGAGALAPEALAAFLGERLARFKIPKAFRVLDQLPRTAYGKVVKGELRESFLAESA
jgi:fatty-acyl-CoA synthase